MVFIINRVWAACGFTGIQANFSVKILYTHIFTKCHGQQTEVFRNFLNSESNLLMPKDISSKFDIDPCNHCRDPLDTKNADRQTTFQLYLIDISVCVRMCVWVHAAMCVCVTGFMKTISNHTRAGIHFMAYCNII